ncbi:MAG: DNA polymerase [Candidatus Eisenbacteria bacterium]
MPQRTGRWGYRRHALQNIPKHVALATELRSGLAAPPGYRLLAADWKAFELRLMAERSGDPNLATACSHTDAYEYLRQQLGGAYSRDQVKVATSRSDTGARDMAWSVRRGMRRMDAERLYRQLSGQMQIALQFAEGAAQTYGSQAASPRRVVGLDVTSSVTRLRPTH